MKTTKKTILSLVVLSLALSLPATTQADWDESQPYKYIQLPDLTTNGMDVDITVRDGDPFPYIRVLADDFECTQTGPVTDIHIWGSWKDDILPPDIMGTNIPGSENVMFFLGIINDIPAVLDPADPDIVLEHSRPGNELLWHGFFNPGQYTSRIYHTLPRDLPDVPNGEGWYDAHENIYTPNADENIWQYNFLIDEAVAFEQKGTSDEPIVYWLTVLAALEPELPGDGVTPANDVIGPDPLFGWKTSSEHWNDDAVYGNVIQDDNGPVTGPDGLQYGFSGWSELRYPDEHPYAGESIDLAFVITPEPATLLVLALGLIPALLKRRRV